MKESHPNPNVYFLGGFRDVAIAISDTRAACILPDVGVRLLGSVGAPEAWNSLVWDDYAEFNSGEPSSAIDQ